MSTPDYLLEIDYTAFSASCQDPLLTLDGQLVLCRRQVRHAGDHATRAGVGAIVWGDKKETH